MMFPEGAHVVRRLAVRRRAAQHLETDRHAMATASPTSASNGSKARRSPAARTTCTARIPAPMAGSTGAKARSPSRRTLVNGHEWKTKAAHIFRCRPDGTGFEPVMTGGMDNPVDVVFTPDGERILSDTFFAVNPRQRRTDSRHLRRRVRQGSRRARRPSAHRRVDAGARPA